MRDIDMAAKPYTKVICVDADGCDLTAGRVYRAQYAIGDGGLYARLIDDRGDDAIYRAHRFAVVEPVLSPSPSPGYQIIAMPKAISDDQWIGLGILAAISLAFVAWGFLFSAGQSLFNALANAFA